MRIIDLTNNNTHNALYVFMDKNIRIFHDITHFKSWNYPAFDGNKYFAVDTLYHHPETEIDQFYGQVTSEPGDNYTYWIEGCKESMPKEFLTQLMLLDVPLR